MANFKAWIEKTRAGNILVRHRDGTRNPKTKRLNKFTDYCIDKNETIMADGKLRTAKWLADDLKQKVMKKYFNDERGESDLTAPLNPLIEEYITDCESVGLAWMTCAHYEDVLEKMVERYGFKTLADLCDAKIIGYKQKASKELMNSTIAGEIIIVFVFTRWLITKKYLKHWPYVAKLIPTVTRGEPKFYPLSEWLALDQATTQLRVKNATPGELHQLRLGCNLAYYEGLRKIEIVGDGKKRQGVQWEDLIWHPDGEVDLVIRKDITKGGKTSRMLRLDPDVVALLGARRTGPIITLSRHRFWYLFTKAREMARVTRTIHQMRHSFAKNFLQDGNMDLSEAKEALGHVDIKTTQIYSHHEKSHLAAGIQQAYKARQIQKRLLTLAGQITDKNAKNGEPIYKPLETDGIESSSEI